MRRVPLLSSVVAFLLGSLLLAAPLATAQTVPPPLAGISVLGSGQASATAETATVVLMLGSNFYYEDPKMMEPVTATPTAPPEEVVVPVINALVGAGVPETGIEILANPYSGDYGPGGGPMTVLLRFELQNPTTEGISQILDAALPAARDAGLFVNMSGVIYGVADCATLEREARIAAIADAREQASVQAELLDLSVGDVIASRDDIYSAMMYGGYVPINSCTSQVYSPSISTLYSAPPFDPSMPAEVMVVVNVDLTFEIVPASEATPAA
jgi:uncharacterized protein YggE